MHKIPHDYMGYVYEWVADEVAARIASGDLPLLSALPNERRLAQEYGVSLGSARRAIDVLRKRGLVTTIRAKGTFVVQREASR
ncbi:GntR family transcriptional regulator [Amycolatopsis jiangsuensis]|uniref:DNA-binding GntR family transcriptional regulator n=1 Tax=Amycolatopsis jiangsuensis TaxID=1181879 RepID=A0A840J180_9PSEU|nr:GntR family transcriptional regulator [Amycolatopsis jiangsuensis]MBB4687405.1 DNA-binding GntR family transcriptional regulator [Amycolatopsis jiangsuensis]